jgi:hypothetical protein
LRELIIACCDTPEILQPAKAALDDVAAFVGFLVAADFVFAVGFAWDDGFDAALLEEGADCIGILAFVGEELFDARDQADAFFGHHAIGGIAWREDERPGAAIFVDNRVDLAVAAAFCRPDRLKIRPPFPPLAQRWILTWLLSSATCSGGSLGPATHANIVCQTPFSLHREKRL